MRTIKASIVALGLTAGLASTASAQLTFDDITSGHFAYVSSYAGLSWNNAFVIDEAYFGSIPAGGFVTARSSGQHVMSNSAALALTMSSTSAFNVAGGNFAAGWMNGLNLNAVGRLNGIEMYNQNYNLDWSVSQYLALNMSGVDEVIFTSSGGIQDASFGPGQNHGFVMDDLDVTSAARITPEEQLSVSVVPEPMTMSLVGIGLLALGGVHARRRRAVAAA